MTAMLASVTNLEEAALAAAMGADWIDLKDPAAGALGALDEGAIRAVVAGLDGLLPLSATIGDCWQTPAIIPDRVAQTSAYGVDYVKVGMLIQGVQRATLDIIAACRDVCDGVIVVCLAEAAPLTADVRQVADAGASGIMLDTANKAGARLPQMFGYDYLLDFVSSARRAGLLCGLAGRLRLADIPQLLRLDADYLGFRSALCAQEARDQPVCPTALAAVRAAIPNVHDNARIRKAGEVA